MINEFSFKARGKRQKSLKSTIPYSFFSIRLRKTGKFMPAGLMVALGVVVLVLIIYR